MSSAVAPRAIYDPELSRPVADPLYRAWIRRLPCAVCSRMRGVECAHTGDRGLSQKASDRRSIPLCSPHHKEYHRIGRRKFEASYKLDIEALIGKLNEKPLVRILGGRFVATLGGEEYALCPVTHGVAAMTRQAIRHLAGAPADRPAIVRSPTGYSSIPVRSRSAIVRSPACSPKLFAKQSVRELLKP